MGKRLTGGLIVAAVGVVIITWVVLSGLTEPSVFSRKVAELEEEGFVTQAYENSFSDAQSSRPGIIFKQTTEWSIFKQQVATVKMNLGFVTVWTHENEGVLWVASSETTYYYWQG